MSDALRVGEIMAIVSVRPSVRHTRQHEHVKPFSKAGSPISQSSHRDKTSTVSPLTSTLFELSTKTGVQGRGQRDWA